MCPGSSNLGKLGAVSWMQEQSSLPAFLCSVGSLVPKKRQHVSVSTQGIKPSLNPPLDLRSLDLRWSCFTLYNSRIQPMCPRQAGPLRAVGPLQMSPNSAFKWADPGSSVNLDLSGLLPGGTTHHTDCRHLNHPLSLGFGSETLVACRKAENDQHCPKLLKVWGNSMVPLRVVWEEEIAHVQHIAHLCPWGGSIVAVCCSAQHAEMLRISTIGAQLSYCGQHCVWGWGWQRIQAAL